MTTVGLIAVGLGLCWVAYDGWKAVGPRVTTATGVSLPDDGTGSLRGDLRKWLLSTALVAFVLAVEGRTLASIGARLPETVPVVGEIGGLLALGAWWVGGTAFTVVLTGVVFVIYQWLDLTAPDEFVDDQHARPVANRLFTGLTAGVTESILYQGYPIERLTTLTGSVLFAAAVSWVAFTAIHGVGDTFSLEETVYIGAPALAVTILYVLSGSLFVIVLVHATVNVVSLLSE